MINKRYESLDCLKGVACLAVVFIHYNFPWDLGIIVRTLAKLVCLYFLDFRVLFPERWKFTDSQSYTEEDLSHSFYFC